MQDGCTSLTLLFGRPRRRRGPGSRCSETDFAYLDAARVCTVSSGSTSAYVPWRCGETSRYCDALSMQIEANLAADLSPDKMSGDQ